MKIFIIANNETHFNYYVNKLRKENIITSKNDVVYVYSGDQWRGLHSKDLVLVILKGWDHNRAFHTLHRLDLAIKVAEVLRKIRVVRCTDQSVIELQQILKDDTTKQK